MWPQQSYERGGNEAERPPLPNQLTVDEHQDIAPSFDIAQRQICLPSLRDSGIMASKHIHLTPFTDF